MMRLCIALLCSWGAVAHAGVRAHAVRRQGAIEIDGKLDDGATVQALAGIYADRAAARLNTARYAEEGRGSDPAVVSLGKLGMSKILHSTARLRRDIIGAEVLIDDRDDQPGDAELANFFTLDAYFTSIGGGTDQIQRNIISERILGLPKEEDRSKNVPFREVRK